jgi:hypothetical protein
MVAMSLNFPPPRCWQHDSERIGCRVYHRFHPTANVSAKGKRWTFATSLPLAVETWRFQAAIYLQEQCFLRK